ncbi:MAG: hypothetical protein KAI17_12495, partial [Thiotrichaceae bacterium]|nr:hypothetical protein [Thiotrichaceae bacterium]
MTCDTRLIHPSAYGKTIALPELIRRWSANAKLINRLCFEKKLMPKLDSRWVSVKKERGKPPIFIFYKSANDYEQFVSEDVLDGIRYEQLPDEVYFDFQEVLEYEDNHSELKVSSVETDSSSLSEELINDRQKAVAEIKASRTAANMSIEALLEESITDLLEAANPKDDNHQYLILHTWIGALETEAKRIGKVHYNNES